MKRIKYVYFYFLFLLYLIVGFFGDVPLIKKGIYENLYNYMGLMLIPTLLFFVLYGFVFMLENKKKRFFWELRLYYIYILFFIIAYIFILANLGINIGTAPGFEINADFIRNLINKSLFEYKIGYLPTYLLYEFINLFKETAVVGYISVVDITMNSKSLQAVYYSVKPILFTGLVYYISVKLFSFIGKRLEMRLKEND